MRYGRWLGWVACWVLASAQHDVESEHTRKVLGSSVVTSVSVIMDHGNGTRTYIADAAGHPLTQHEGPVGSPADLLAPDRYEFYTFDESGDLIKKLMTLDQIHGLIAGGDADALDSMDSSAPTYYHAGNQGHIDVSDLEPTDIQGVHKVVANVQNVLKGELEASKNKPLSTKPISMLSVPDAASSWSILLPGVLGGAEDAMSEAVLSEPEGISKFTVQSSARPTVTETISTQENSLPANEPTVKPSASDTAASASPPTQSTPTKTTYEKPHTVTTTTEKLLSSVKTIPPTTEESTTVVSTKKRPNLTTTTPAVPVTQRRTNSPTIIHYLTIQNVHATSIIPDRTTEKSSPAPLRTTPGSPTLSASHSYEKISPEQYTTRYESITPEVSQFHEKVTSTESSELLSSVTPSPQTSERTTIISSPSSSQVYEKIASSSSPWPFSTLSTFLSTIPQLNNRITDAVSTSPEYDLKPPQIYEKIPAVSSSGSSVSTTYNSVTPSESQIFERIPAVSPSGSPISTTYNSVTSSESQTSERLPAVSPSESPISTTYNSVTSSESQIFERIPAVSPSGSPFSTTYNSVTPSESQTFEIIPAVSSSVSPVSTTYDSVTPSEPQLFERIPAVSPSVSPVSTTYDSVTPSEPQLFERIPAVSSSGSPVSTTDNLLSHTSSDERVTDVISSGSPAGTVYSSVIPPASLIYEIITNINSTEPLSTTYISKPQPVTEKSTPEPLRSTYSSISSPVSQIYEVATDKYSEKPLNATYSSVVVSATVPDVSERVTETENPELLRIKLTEAAPAAVTNTYQPTSDKPLHSSLVYSESSTPLSADFSQTSTSKLDSPQSIPIIEGMAASLSDVLSQVTDKQNYTTDYTSATRPQSDKTDAESSEDHATHVYIDVTTAKYTPASTDETFETQYTNQHLYTLVRNPPEGPTTVAETESASFYDKPSESTESHRVTSEVTGAESDLPSTSDFNSFTETSFLNNANEELHEVHLKSQQSEQVVKIVTPETLTSQSSLDISITTYKPRPVTSSTHKPITSQLSTEQLLSTLSTPKVTDYSASSLINSASEKLSDTTNSAYKPIFASLGDNEETTIETTTGVQLSSSAAYENNSAIVDNNHSYNISDAEKENNASKLSVQSSPPELLDTENTLLKAGISAVTSILLDQQSPNEPQLPLPTDSLIQSSGAPELVDPVSGELKHASTFGSEYDTTVVTDGDTEAYSAVTATEDLITTTIPVEDENKQETIESSGYSIPLKKPAGGLYTTSDTENISEIYENTESATAYSVDTITTITPQNKPFPHNTLAVKTNASHVNVGQTLPTKESKLSEDQSEQNVTKNDYKTDAFVDEAASEQAAELGDNKEQLEFAQSIVSNSTAQNLNFANRKPATEPPKQEISLTQDNTKPSEIMEKVELKTAVPASDSKVSFLKKPATAYRPVPSEVSLTPPTAVELHPAPHESMGLEATTAFLADDVRRFSDLCNELAFRMWNSITGKGSISSRSIVLSPFAVSSLLAMVFLGARGPTSGQMNDVLRLDDMVTFNPHQVLQNVTESVLNSKNFGVATAAFVRELYSDKSKGKILDFYKERAQQYYDGHVEEISFHVIGDILRRRTNLLVKRQTLGKVAEYLRGSGLHMRPPLAAFSANIFQTDCEQGSTDGRDGEMYFVVRPSTRQRRLVPVPAAVWRTGFLAGYEPGLDATAVSLGSDSVVSTILILPGQQGQVAPGDGLARLEQRLIETSYRRGGWSRLLRSLLPRPGLELQIPRYSHRSVLNVTGALQRMGLKDLFNAGRADLRGLNGLSNDLHLSDMVQVNTFSTCGEETIGARHHVETYPVSPQRMGRDDPEMYPEPDEEEESPFSALPLALRPRQARLPDNPRLRFDRPFLYMVRHNPTGMILHMGRFNPRLLP